MIRSAFTHIGVVMLGLLSACSSPTYVNKGEGESGWIGLNDVTYQVHDSFKQAPPDCIAILPLTAKSDSERKISSENLTTVRLSLYAHLSTQSKRLFRLERVDYLLTETNGDPKVLTDSLKCGALIEGQVTEYGNMFFGIYSRVAAGLEIRMIRASDGALLWEGKHVAVSHGGSIPLDPVGVAMGIADAIGNIQDEQILRVTDDLTRRLVSTIPDNKVSGIDDPADAPLVAQEKVLPNVSTPSDDLALAEKLFADGDYKGALDAANRVTETTPDKAKAWFIKGRVLMLDQDYAQAEPAIVKAVALDRSNPKFLNALGAVNAAKGNLDRALAAYKMAVAAESWNGFAWYNSAVIYLNQGNATEAADGFYAAGLAYTKSADYAKAERALDDLRELAKAGQPVSHHIKALQEALAAKARRET